MALQPIRRAIRTYANVGRLRRVLVVLIRHGMGDVVRRLHIDYYLRLSLWWLWRRAPRPEPQPRRLGQRIRAALVELGPTFVKLGQVLSTRPDLIPADVAEELAGLQDQVPAEPFETVMEVIRSEGLTDAFEREIEHIEPEPIAAASMAQAHRARLRTGEEIVLKVQRPSVSEVLRSDIRLLEDLAALLERDEEIRDLFRPTELVRQFERSVEQELDFRREGRTMDRFREIHRRNAGVHVPAVHWSLTTDRVLAMEFVDGIKISDTHALDAAGCDRSLVARRTVDAMLQQINEDGLFHGDPHPGNLRVLPGDVVCFLDFGIVGRIDADTQQQLTDFLLAIVNR
ncbi:MAG: AarF/ABC1/UbiB kinase family protein, partial [Planctomycetes bacterium]|nr:AarF/ABC1/UbiB kinase family protein [Planctomycetota bacterium]